MFDWDDLKIFLTVGRMRRVAPAARALGMDATTVLRRLARLSDGLSATLLETVAGERSLTERGKILFDYAEGIETIALAARGEVSGEASSLEGQVRLSLPEGFAGWIVAPALSAFRAAHPKIQIDLITSSGFLNPSKRESDIAVMLARPRTGRLTAVKLGNYALRLYCSQNYTTVKGAPDAVADLKQHTLIGYVPEFVDSPELDYIEEVGAGLEAGVRSTSINVQHRLIASGLGIGVLPAFIGDRDPTLQPVLPDAVALTRSFWLVTHNDRRSVARIKAVRLWIQQCFNELVVSSQIGMA